VVHSGTAEPEICQSVVGMSEVEMPAGVAVVDPDQRNVGSTAGSEDAMTCCSGGVGGGVAGGVEAADDDGDLV